MVKRQIHFNEEEILTQISLYNIGVPITTIAAIYRICGVTMWKRMKEYEKLSLVKFRTKSETVSMTLSKKRKIPIEDKYSSMIVKQWKKEFGVKGLIDILTIILLTDGWGSYKYKTISLSNKDKNLINLFISLLKELGLNVRETKDKRKDIQIIFSRQNKAKEILDKIYKITPTTKHQPQRGEQTWGDYSKEIQPTIFLLYQRPKNLRELLFRIGMSFEGCVSLSKNKKRYGRPRLCFTCFHPILIKEWKEIAESIEINMLNCGNMLQTSNFKSIINFLKIGGFIEGSKTGGNSKYFEGIEKNCILLSMLEYSYRESKKNKILEKPSSYINKEIRKIADNKEFKTPNFYIDYFLDLLNKYNGNLTKTKIMDVLKERPKRTKEIMQKTSLSECKVRSMLRTFWKKGELIKISDGLYFKK